MSQSFLERFYEDVDSNLDDASTSKRLPKARRLRMLYAAQKIIWERLMRATGQESILGRVEVELVLKNNQRYYPLPGNFRQFLALEFRSGGDSTRVTNRLRSTPFWDQSGGVLILSEQRGMMVQPSPSLAADETWTLVYLKSDVVLHTAASPEITALSIKSGTPATDFGEIIEVDDYYTGSMIGLPDSKQVREIVGYKASTGTFQLRHPLVHVPAKGAVYEIRPLLPEAYDDIYAIDVAIRVLGQRKGTRGRSGLKDDRKALWDACHSYFVSNVADRAPGRVLPPTNEMDPYWGS